MKKNLLVTSLLGSMLFSSLALTSNVNAESYDNQIEENKQVIQENNQEIESLNQNIQSLESQKSATEAELQSINQNILATEQKLNDLVAKLEAAQAQMNELLTEIDVLNENIGKRNEKLAKQARTVQVDGDPSNYLEFVIASESLSDAIGRMDIVSSLVRANRQLVQEQLADKALVEEKKVASQKTIDIQHAATIELEEMSSALEQKRLEKEVLVAQIAADKATAESDRNSALAKKAEAENRVASYINAQAEAARATQQAIEDRENEQTQVAQTQVEQTQVSQTESASSSSSNEASTTAPSTSNSSQASAPSNNSNNQATPPSSSNSSNSSSNNQTTQPVKTEKPKEKPKQKPKAPAPKPSSSPIAYAMSFTGQGIRYVWGGGTPAGFDCSGFTSYVFRNTRGISLSRTAAGQYAGATKVSNPQPGDLVFFAQSGTRVTHVGIYIGGGQFVGSQTSTGPAVTGVHSSYWGPKLVGYGRY